MSHKLIGICVESDNKEQAAKEADEILVNQLQADHFGFFDWAIRSDSVNSRFNDIPAILKTTDELAQTKIQEMFEWTKDEYQYHLFQLQEILKTSPNTFEDGTFRYNAHCLGTKAENYLFDCDGEAVDNTKAYERVKSGTCYDNKKTMFVVFYDAHS